MSKWKNPVCRGSRLLGTACGSCEKCQGDAYLSEPPSDKIKELEKKLTDIKALIAPYMRVTCRGYSCCAYCSTLENLAEDIDEVLTKGQA